MSRPYLNLSLCLALLLGGCGASDLVSSGGFPAGTSSVASTAQPFLVRVLDEQQRAVAGVDVVIHERTSNQKYTSRTAADGSVTLTVPDGVYDLGLNNSADPSSATCFYGPVVSSGTQTFVLRSTGGRPASTLFGRILVAPGQPASNRRVTVRPLLLNSGGGNGLLPNPITITTSPAGLFETDLSTSQDLSADVEIYQNNGIDLDEWVDVGKLGKACYVEFASDQLPVENRLHADETDPPVGPGSTVRIQPKLLSQFTQTFPPSILWNQHTLLTGGKLTVDLFSEGVPNVYTISELVPGGLTRNQLPTLNNFKIVNSDDGMWWWPYSVRIYHPAGGLGTHWEFTDETDDTYVLNIVSSNTDYPGTWHKVSYKSDKPSIVKIFLAIAF